MQEQGVDLIFKAVGSSGRADWQVIGKRGTVVMVLLTIGSIGSAERLQLLTEMFFFHLGGSQKCVSLFR
jgi:hypothetical protein